MVRKFDHSGCLCPGEEANDFANSYSSKKVCHWGKQNVYNNPNGYARFHAETPLCQMSAQSQVCMLGRMRKRQRLSQGCFRNTGQQEVMAKEKRGGRFSVETRLPVPKSLQTHGKRMLISRTLKLFPAALKPLLEVKTPVKAPHNAQRVTSMSCAITHSPNHMSLPLPQNCWQHFK